MELFNKKLVYVNVEDLADAIIELAYKNITGIREIY